MRPVLCPPWSRIVVMSRHLVVGHYINRVYLVSLALHRFCWCVHSHKYRTQLVSNIGFWTVFPESTVPIEKFIEDQALLRLYDSAPRPSPSPRSSIRKFSFFLSLPVCCLSSLLTGGGGGGGGGARARESLAFYKSFIPLWVFYFRDCGVDKLSGSLSDNCPALLDNLAQSEARIAKIFEAASIEEVSLVLFYVKSWAVFHLLIPQGGRFANEVRWTQSTNCGLRKN